MKLHVLEKLEEKGLTKYKLYKATGMSYQNFNKMVKNETKSVQYDQLEIMCNLLDCTPNDIIY